MGRGATVEEPKKKKSVKRQIRDTKKLLSRVRAIVVQCTLYVYADNSKLLFLFLPTWHWLQEDLPETVRLTKERVLKLLQQELTEKAKEKKSKKFSKKYRMVKFFGMILLQSVQHL